MNPPHQSVRTADGSLTLRHPGYREHYHALEGARAEAESKFIRPARLAERLRRTPVRILDVGFGLGLNCQAILDLAAAVARHPVEILSVEADPNALPRALTIAPESPLLRDMANTGTHITPKAKVRLMADDLRRAVSEDHEPFDLIFHDPFSPMKNTECWTVELFTRMRDLLCDDGLWLTYSEAQTVRAGLLQAGFAIGATPPMPPHRGGTMAARNASLLPLPLDPTPFHSFPANIPFHDPTFHDDPRTIRAQREATIRDARQRALTD